MSNKFMTSAINEAVNGMKKGSNRPYGAVVVKDGKVIAKGFTSAKLVEDVTAHAEMNAIRKACKKLNVSKLDGCEIYTTSIPCDMCMGAIKWAKIKNVYYGCEESDAVLFDFPMNIEENLNLKSIDRERSKKVFAYWQELNKK